ncbi:predicted protein [Lichtheimia corymbifera JMRC:FSU:9682]|uniref:Uncharacterized protein n=1 Tax=Lichtheimia corymbifera JMRC:FSU:9682 TaxID=1263082 RepID=A0A068RXW4_9FUNG|nr:predicted protein [Lichtheimia corymbifera JMRC:FSU:9682]
MDVDSYRHTYSGRDKYILFFTTTDFKHWDFKHFRNQFSNTDNPPSKKTLESAYLNALDTIAQHPNTPTAVKLKLKDLKATIHQLPINNNYHIQQGDSSIVSFGESSSNSTTVVYQGDTDIRSPKRQKTATVQADDNSHENEDNDDDEKCALISSPPPMLRKPEIHLGPALDLEASTIAQRFYMYKKEVVTRERETTFYFETHLFDLLSLNHILLLKPSQYSQRQLNIFGRQALESLYNNFLDDHCCFDSTLDLEFLKGLMECVKRPGFDRETVVASCFQLITQYKFQSFEYRAIRMVINMLEEFPSVPMIKKMGEHDIIALVVDIILRPIFSGYSSRLRWPEINAEERKCRTNRVERPDAILSDIEDMQFTRSRVFREVKPEDADSRSMGVDFVRIAVFGKDAIDCHMLNKVLLFQVIGCKVTFYVQALVDEGVYVLAELCQITLPTSLQELVNLLNDLGKLLDVYRTLESTGPSLDHEAWKKNSRETLDTPRFRQALRKYSRKNRLCLVHL